MASAQLESEFQYWCFDLPCCSLGNPIIPDCRQLFSLSLFLSLDLYEFLSLQGSTIYGFPNCGLSSSSFSHQLDYKLAECMDPYFGHPSMWEWGVCAYTWGVSLYSQLKNTLRRDWLHFLYLFNTYILHINILLSPFVPLNPNCTLKQGL